MDFAKMFIVTFVIMLVICNGSSTRSVILTTTSPSSYSSSTLSTPETTEDYADGHPMDSFLPGTKAPFIPVEFIDSPSNLETEVGASVMLPCRTKSPVLECQWSWQSLPPTYLPLPDTSNENDTSIGEISVNVNSTSTASLPVRQFPAFGNNSNDCSVRFTSTRHEHAGYWTCAARGSRDDSFTSTTPAKLTIIINEQDNIIAFEPQEISMIETPLDSTTQIECRSKVPVRECQWYWRQLGQPLPWNLEVKKFPAFGNNSNDCSIKLKNVMAEQEGIWTCAARIHPNATFSLNDPVYLFISQVEFVQLSRTVQISAGETVLLRCVVNKPVVECEWSWKQSNNSESSTVMKKFSPSKEADHDCSVRFKNVLQKEEGLWTCGVRLVPNGLLHTAPAATIALLPSGDLKITELPKETSVLNGTSTTLKCVTNSRIEKKCIWKYKPSNGPEIVYKEFPSNGDLGTDCSLDIDEVSVQQQGYWTCQVSLVGLNSVVTAPPVRLTVYDEEVVFSEISKDIQISIGGTVLLRCVTTSAVERCRWSLTPVNTNVTVVVKEFPAAGSEARDCSVRLSHALGEQEGLWTCGAKLKHQQAFTNAPPAKLSLLEPEITSVILWAEPHQLITLACRIGEVSENTKCHWIHLPDFNITNNDANSVVKLSHSISMNHTNGLCILKFAPTVEDLGEWICKFTVETKDKELHIGGASIVLLSDINDDKLGLVVGILTALILLILILAVVLVVCKMRFFNRKNGNVFRNTPTDSDKQRKPNKDDHKSYVGDPSKLNIKFMDQSGLPSTLSIDQVLPNRSPNRSPYMCSSTRQNVTNFSYENVKV